MSKLIPILIGVLLLITGCSTTHKIHTDSTKELTKELKELFPSIEKVDFTFTRPDLSCRIDMSKEPSKEELEAILTVVERFTTVDNMNEIARSVKWGLEISKIYLDMNTDEDTKTIEHAYYARYFKTSNASDYSETNIEGYKIWYKVNEK
ncbi:hypothetical protein M3629_04980 [Paenibacillus polysaccharolyticus]|uniref:hypothetical protein n=1 Tax=Paenibacillus polysaccharolyticus TaxID=582692 RepID=UPI002041CB76|nr:hypothetical protein [Paenibacillus polysaccharolyticus]MCM3132127.1 hypothetical protein [Paenibacillus polysaccharolyticus]